jgi:hypothetical protein
VVWSLTGSFLVNFLLCIPPREGITDKLSSRGNTIVRLSGWNCLRISTRTLTSWCLRNYVGITQVPSIMHSETIHWFWRTTSSWLVNTATCPLVFWDQSARAMCTAIGRNNQITIFPIIWLQDNDECVLWLHVLISSDFSVGKTSFRPKGVKITLYKNGCDLCSSNFNFMTNGTITITKASSWMVNPLGFDCFKIYRTFTIFTLVPVVGTQVAYSNNPKSRIQGI